LPGGMLAEKIHNASVGAEPELSAERDLEPGQ
jgi:hypothetical protein